MDIIPSINVPTFEEVRERIKKVEPYVEWCHLDVTDGIFSKHVTWHDPADLPLLNIKLKAEVHLMVSQPEKVFESWLVEPIKRIIVHLEAVSDLDLIIRRAHAAGIEVGLAINPETFWGRLVPYFPKPHSRASHLFRFLFGHPKWGNYPELFQVLTVHPGPSGQDVDWEEMLGKVRHIREHCKGCIIEVDGGINPHTYKNAVSAGANILVSGAYLFNAEDIGTAIGKLKK